MAEKIAKLVDYSDEILKSIQLQQEKQKAILEQLNKVEQPYQNILFKVYIQNKNLETVSSEMGYTYRHLCRMYGIALNIFDSKNVL